MKVGHIHVRGYAKIKNKRDLISQIFPVSKDCLLFVDMKPAWIELCVDNKGVEFLNFTSKYEEEG